jgi:diguanylate cyclase (GGDEF)-like protein
MSCKTCEATYCYRQQVRSIRQSPVAFKGEEATLQPNLQKFEDSARADKLRLLYHQSFPAVFISLANALLLSIILWSHLDLALILGWAGAICLIGAVRLMLFLGYRRIENDEGSFVSWEKPYFVILVVSSLVWGLGCAWMMSQACVLDQAIIYCFLIGMAGGAISVYSAVRSLVLTIVFAVLLPATIWLLLQGSTTFTCLGIGGVLFLSSAIRATTVLVNALHRSYLLNHELLDGKKQAELAARTDFLTGLYNRRYFNELAKIQIEFCRRHNHPVALIVLDVDNFKRINDKRGHYAGDLALQKLSAILMRCTRSSDVCGRMGGEEFAVLLPNATVEQAKTTAERIRITVANTPITIDDDKFNITVSLGIAAGGVGSEDLLKMADKAMYRAKETGRNQVCHYSSSVDGALLPA